MLLLAPLSDQERQRVQAAMQSGHDKVLVHFKKGRTDVSMTQSELRCMDPGAWLNDKA